MSSLFLFVQVQLGSLGAKFVLPVCCFVCLHQSFMVDHGWLAMDGACMVDHQWSTMHSCTKHNNIHIQSYTRYAKKWRGQSVRQTHPPLALLASRGQNVGQAHPSIGFVDGR